MLICVFLLFQRHLPMTFGNSKAPSQQNSGVLIVPRKPHVQLIFLKDFHGFLTVQFSKTNICGISQRYQCDVKCKKK